MEAPFTITAESLPVYDDWFWADYWSAGDWITWHQALRAKFGLDEANKKFIEAYHKAGALAASYNWRTFDSTFIKHAKDNGYYDGLFSGLGGLLGRLASTGNTVVTGAADVANSVVGATTGAVDNAGKAITNTSNLLKWLVPVLILILVAGGLYVAAKKYKVV